MSIYISDAVVAGDTTVAVEPGAGLLSLTGRQAQPGVGVAPNTGAGALSLTGRQAAVSAGVALDPQPGTLDTSGTQPAPGIGVRPAPQPGALAFTGLAPFIVVRGRIVVISDEVVLQSRPPMPFVCLRGVAVDESAITGRLTEETELQGRLVDESRLSGYYQLDFEECN